MKQLTSHALSDDEVTQSDGDDIGIVPTSFCERCTRLDFGDSVQDEVFSASSRFSRRSMKVRDLQPKNCQLCAQLAELGNWFDDTPPSWPHRFYRYIPAGAAIHSHDINASNSADSQVDQLLHFKINARGDSGSFADGEYVSTAIHSFAPVSNSRDTFSMQIADLLLAKKWYQHCSIHHNEACGSKSVDFVPYFKVIDCLNGRICDATVSQAYVALSYLWGASTAELQTDSVNDSTEFPRTIQDAMLVATALGIPHLWVDRYCIDQSNAQEKHSLITNMNSIYSGAEVTIVAAAGSNPHHGLPGVSQTSRKGMSTVTLDRGFLVGFPDAADEILAHSWSTRGWTYQEMLLSRRRLVFTDSQIFFQCCRQDFREACGLPSTIFTRQDSADTMKHVLSDAQLGCTSAMFGYDKPLSPFPESIVVDLAMNIHPRITCFSSMNLTYPEDILNAFSGVFDAFNRGATDYTHHFWGVPILNHHFYNKQNGAMYTFLYGLSWHSPLRGPGARRLERRPGQWPSWSWTSVMGGEVRFGVRTAEAIVFVLQGTLCVRLLHRTGNKEEIWIYAQQQHDFLDYEPAIELSTWLLWGGRLQCNGDDEIFTHPSFSQASELHDLRVDRDVQDEQPLDDVVAAYLGTSCSDYHPPTLFFLVMNKARDGAFRRIGIIRFGIEHEMYMHFHDAGKVTWLPGPDSTDSLNAWEYGTVTLV